MERPDESGKKPQAGARDSHQRQNYGGVSRAWAERGVHASQPRRGCVIQPRVAPQSGTTLGNHPKNWTTLKGL